MIGVTPSLLRARRILAAPERDSLRAAKGQRRAALREYWQALDAMSPRHLAAVRAYHAALSAEAAANRAEARELRELLSAIVHGHGEGGRT